MNNNEIWKDIPNYEGMYQASNLGQIRSLRRNGTLGRILKGEIDDSGYIKVALSKNNKIKKYKIHRLVAQTFIPNLNDLPQINHKDGNKKNNCINNLEWCTASYNTRHSYINNLNKTKGKKIIVINKLNNKEIYYRSMRDASLKMGYNKGYLFKKIKTNIFENNLYKWMIYSEQV